MCWQLVPSLKVSNAIFDSDPEDHDFPIRRVDYEILSLAIPWDSFANLRPCRYIQQFSTPLNRDVHY
jgi:hypothetical protein